MAEAEKSNITQLRHLTPQELATERLKAGQLARQMGLTPEQRLQFLEAIRDMR
jgi:hypothetical protein